LIEGGVLDVFSLFVTPAVSTVGDFNRATVAVPADRTRRDAAQTEFA
jgi:hypothetical protein